MTDFDFIGSHQAGVKTTKSSTDSPLASSCWDEPIADKIILSGTDGLRTLRGPYILGHCEPVGRMLSYSERLN